MQPQSTNSAKYLQQRKFFLALPILVFPFLTFLLWSIGLIGVPATQAQTISQEGFNSNLPGALPSKDSSWNKLKFYEQADRDSARYRTLQKNDPNYSLSIPKSAELLVLDTVSTTKEIERDSKLLYDPYPAGLQTSKDPNEAKVYRKIAQLNEELKKAKLPGDLKNNNALQDNSQSATAAVNTDDISRLENMMQTMQGSDNSGDPEMQQISGMLEKILDIQHPQRIKDKLKLQSEVRHQQVFPVIMNEKKMSVSLLQGRQKDSNKASQVPLQHNSFYSIDDGTINEGEQQNAISAIIPETQTLVAGATVKLKLNNEVYINGILIPKDEFIYGIAALDGERLTISITTIRFKNNILPVSLAVYDTDGMIGIYVPWAISRDVAKQSTEQAIQGIGLASLDPSIGAQAASAGIQAAKSLIAKKIIQVKVTVKAGYQVLLRDENQKNM